MRYCPIIMLQQGGYACKLVGGLVAWWVVGWLGGCLGKVIGHLEVP